MLPESGSLSCLDMTGKRLPSSKVSGVEGSGVKGSR